MPAWPAPDLRNGLPAAKTAGYGHLVVDGTVVETDRISAPGPTSGVDLWWSAKAHNHGRLSRPTTAAALLPVGTRVSAHSRALICATAALLGLIRNLPWYRRMVRALRRSRPSGYGKKYRYRRKVVM